MRESRLPKVDDGECHCAGSETVILRLVRRWFTEISTIGELYVDGERECFTLEDRVREGPKVPGKTAIPEGTYAVIITQSARFKRELPLLLEVPGFTGIRIHPGNTAENTEGCILVGQTRGADWIGRSRAAFDPLFAKLQTGLQARMNIGITITHEDPDDLEISPEGGADVN
jgi:hypothetical protein